jgi:ribonuclease VapC
VRTADGPGTRSLDAIEPAESNRISVASFVEISIVIEFRYGSEGLRDLDRFISQASIELIPVDTEQGQLAGFAFSRFGKGRHAPDSITAIASRTRPRSI